MKSVDSKLLLGLIVGAAVGVTVGYLCATDKKEQILEELNNVLGKVKDGVKGVTDNVKGVIAKTKCECDKVTEEIVAE